jgi:hypothetical protein
LVAATNALRVPSSSPSSVQDVHAEVSSSWIDDCSAAEPAEAEYPPLRPLRPLFAEAASPPREPPWRRPNIARILPAAAAFIFFLFFIGHRHEPGFEPNRALILQPTARGGGLGSLRG